MRTCLGALLSQPWIRNANNNKVVFFGDSIFALSGEIQKVLHGFDDEQIARMEEVDQRREARWQNGLAYMQERARIESTFEGDAREAELRALREEYFAYEAPTVEAEERGGFFRFERPRIYGRN